MAAVTRAKDRLLATRVTIEKLGERVQLAYKARAALDVYLDRLAEAKVEELQGVVLECFRRICRKPDLVATLKIDPKTFEVTLRDSAGARNPSRGSLGG